MKIFYRIISILFSILFAISGFTQPSYNEKDAKRLSDTISIEFIKNKILIPVSINNIERRFVFDTGAFLSISQVIQDQSNYELSHNDIISDANGIKNSIPFVLIKELSIGRIKFENNISTVLNIDSTLFRCFDIDGFIGSNILKNFIIKIDIQNRKLIFSNQKDFFKRENGYTLPLKKLKNNIPIITNIHPFKKAKEEIIFDTGDESFYSISNRSYHLFDKKIGLSDYIRDISMGGASIGLYGMEKDTMKYLIKTDEFNMNKFIFRNMFIKNTSDTNSRLGADILNYGSVILDYISNKFTFIPYTNSQSISLEKKTRDFDLSEINEEIQISLIWEKSESYKMGLRKGFIIKKINNIEIKKDDICNIFFNIQQELSKNQLEILAVDAEGKEHIYHINKESNE